MNSSIFSSRSNTARVVRTALLATLLFFLLDRGLFFALREAAFGFYSSGQVGKDWYGKTNAVQKDYFNTLIMGTSRTKEGIHPIYLFEKLGYRAFNAASPGRYPQYNYLFYQQFKKKYGTPKVVILGIDYFLFSKDSNPRQLQELKGDGNAGERRIEYRKAKNPNSKLLSRVSLLYRTKASLDQFFVDAIDRLAVRFENKTNKNILPAGISKYTGLYGSVPNHTSPPPQNWPKSPYTPFPGKEGRFFEKLLNTLRRDRVKVFLVGIPDYHKVYQTNHQHRKLVDDIQKLASQYMNVVYLNYNTPAAFELDNPHLFVDGDWGKRISHLSVFGSKMLTYKLCNDIQNHFRREKERRL